MIDQEWIDKAVKDYNRVTKAHKRAPVEKYVKKQLEAGESVELLAGAPRWTSGLQLTGSVDKPQANFVINESVPESFKKMLEKMQEQFEQIRTN